ARRDRARRVDPSRAPRRPRRGARHDARADAVGILARVAGELLHGPAVARVLLVDRVAAERVRRAGHEHGGGRLAHVLLPGHQPHRELVPAAVHARPRRPPLGGRGGARAHRARRDPAHLRAAARHRLLHPAGLRRRRGARPGAELPVAARGGSRRGGLARGHGAGRRVPRGRGRPGAARRRARRDERVDAAARAAHGLRAHHGRFRLRRGTRQDRARPLTRQTGGMDPSQLSLVDLAAALRGGEVSPVEATQAFLERIRAHDDLGAFVEVTAERALDRARALGTPREGAPPLWGVPLADKDLTARAGVPTRYGSRAFRDFVPDASDPLALALDRLGSVSLGKTSTPEFGLTGYTEPAAGRPARNPWDPATGAGGSSGGAAVAVAAGLLPAAPASDAGGSIRIPAATVGVVGLKPSRGRLPFVNGLDAPGGLGTAGPIARSVADAALLLGALTSSAPRAHATGAPDPDGAFAGR